MIPYPRASYLAHQHDIDAAIARVLSDGVYILGKEVAQFEEEFAAYLGVPACAAVASGTDALELALRACGVGKGSTVIVPSFTAVACVVAIERAGAEPFLVDIHPGTLNIDVEQVARALELLAGEHHSAGSRASLAVIAVHLFGCPADVASLRDITNRFNALLIEDCAQAHGAQVQNRLLGTWGDAASFSFYPTKNLAALGDGGAVVSMQAEVVDRVRLLRQYGWVTRSVSETRGINSRLDEVQAAVLRVKLRNLDAENEARVARAKVYDRVLADSDLTLPSIPTGGGHVYHQYVVRSPRRDALASTLNGLAVPTGIHYPLPVHSHPAYRDAVRNSGQLEQSERASQTALSLPMSPHMSLDETAEVARLVRQHAGERSA